jgi:outer membrane murein-binding lipoprotein Lpp
VIQWKKSNGKAPVPRGFSRSIERAGLQDSIADLTVRRDALAADCDRLPGEVDVLNGKVEALRSELAAMRQEKRTELAFSSGNLGEANAARAIQKQHSTGEQL